MSGRLEAVVSSHLPPSVYIESIMAKDYYVPADFLLPGPWMVRVGLESVG